MDNNNNRRNSSEQRKKLMYAREHMKGRKYKVLRPEQRKKNPETNDTTLKYRFGNAYRRSS